MKIFPAIDLRGGKAVRLLRGEYDQMTVYDDDPVRVAEGFARAGASNLHVVDLDGALSGKGENAAVIRRIVSACGMEVEIGGGIRTESQIAAWLETGAARVILGTAAAERPAFAGEMAKRYGGKIAVGADLKDGKVATHGWTRVTDTDAFAFFDMLTAMGVQTVICTDVSRDGALAGTNLELYRALTGRFSMNLIASGGITTVAELETLAKMGLYGAILGKALYHGDIRLADAVRTERL